MHLGRFTILYLKALSSAAFRNPMLPIGDAADSIFPALFRFQIKDFTVIRKIGLALVLTTVAGVASAGDGGTRQCFQLLPWLPPICFFEPSSPVQAPEIDPASAMAGLTMLAGGLAVLRGRRRIKSKE